MILVLRKEEMKGLKEMEKIKENDKFVIEIMNLRAKLQKQKVRRSIK